MKHATEVIELLAPYPGKHFKMAQILRHVVRGRPLTARETEAARKAVRRVLVELERNGQVVRSSSTEKSATYAWKAPSQLRVPDSNNSGTLRGTILRPQLRL